LDTYGEQAIHYNEAKPSRSFTARNDYFVGSLAILVPGNVITADIKRNCFM
jgi:hypothetical protein